MKRKLLIVYVFIAFVLLCTNVYAALTMDLSLVPASEKVKQGSDLVIAVKLNNVSAPVSSIEGYINVDENVLEPISESMIKGDKIAVKADGKTVSELDYVFNPKDLSDADCDVIFNTNKENIDNNDCLFVMDLRKDIKGNCDIMTLNFKVKEDATVAQATQAVKFKIASAVSASDLKDKVTDLSANLSFEVLDKNATIEEPPKPDDNKTDDNKTDDNTNKPDDDKPDDNKPEKKELKGEISYSTTSETTGPVTATLKVDDGVTVTNNSGKKTYTFSKNGYYIFEFADDAGNTGKARAEVSWIKSTTGNGNNNNDNDDKKNENKNINNTNTNKNTNNNTNNNTNKNTNKNINDTTVAGSKIPKAGAGMLILPVIVFIVLGYVSYIKYLKYKEV